MNEIKLQRILATGHTDGIFRSDSEALPVHEPSLARAARRDPAFIDRILAVSAQAPVRTGALAGLAVALKRGNTTVRRQAAALASTVCHSGRDLLLLADGLRRLGGFGRLTRRCLAEWYTHRPVDALRAEVGQTALGWRHRDVLRLCHVRTSEPERNACLAALARQAEVPAHRAGPVGLTWPRGHGRRLIALDASATLECGSILGEAPKTVAARWGLAGVAAHDAVVTFRADGWRDSETQWRTGVTPLKWHDRTGLTEAVRDLDANAAGPPDPALLVRYATAHRLPVHAFIIVGARAPWPHPDARREALSRYRDRTPGAAMVVVGLKSGGQSLTDPADPRSWGVEGFEPRTPSMVAYLADL